jgi:hypothetical protein
MLLIGQPKSATTSLARTIARMGKLKCRLGIPKKKGDIRCKGFQTIQRHHDNMSVRSQKFLMQVINGKKTIFKEHLLPTDNHLQLLNKIKGKIVILLRNPEHSIDSYGRLGIKNFNLIRDGILNDLIKFNKKYKEWAIDKKNILVIDYDDLILTYNNTMRKILKHYGIRYKKLIPLMKKKYTGVGLERLLKKR